MSEDWAAVRSKVYPTLDRQYPLQDEAAAEQVADVGLLIGLIYDTVRVQTSILKDPDIERDVRLRTTHHIVGRIIRLGVFLAKRKEAVGEFENEYRRQLENLLDVDAALFERIFRLGRRVSEFVTNKKGKISKGNRSRILKLARTHLHNCRFCGSSLTRDEGAETALEIEHLIAQALGGSSHRSNITVACNRCNKIKEDRLSFVDVYHEHFCVVSDKKENVSQKLGPHIVFALLMKQDGKCFHCERYFYAIAPEKIVLTRREEDDYYHFRNCYVACEPCAERVGIDGIEIDVPLPLRN
ncbi:HNH endonuclease [Bradyrhizobium sp. USDA 4486]